MTDTPTPRPEPSEADVKKARELLPNDRGTWYLEVAAALAQARVDKVGGKRKP